MTIETQRKPRSIPRLIGEALRLYTRFPLLFLVLAAGVVVPYRLIVLATTGAGPFTERGLGFGTSMLLTAIEWVIVDPLVSALHVHAVAETEEGRTPQLGEVTRRGLAVLPLVAAAAIMSGLAMGAGFLLLVIPGIYIFLRLPVVAQAAAIERETWTDALRRSWELTEGNVLRVVYFILCISAITLVPGLLVNALLSNNTTAGTFLVGVAVQVVVLSFTALATALLYFDLRARYGLPAPRHEETGMGELGESPPQERSIDPRRYSDEERPKGWYVDPTTPHRMHYWKGDPPVWAGTTRTPRKLRRAWEKEQKRAETSA